MKRQRDLFWKHSNNSFIYVRSLMKSYRRTGREKEKAFKRAPADAAFAFSISSYILTENAWSNALRRENIILPKSRIAFMNIEATR